MQHKEKMLYFNESQLERSINPYTKTEVITSKVTRGKE